MAATTTCWRRTRRFREDVCVLLGVFIIHVAALLDGDQLANVLHVTVILSIADHLKKKRSPQRTRVCWHWINQAKTKFRRFLQREKQTKSSPRRRCRHEAAGTRQSSGQTSPGRTLCLWWSAEPRDGRSTDLNKQNIIYSICLNVNQDPIKKGDLYVDQQRVVSRHFAVTVKQ